eukprot:TRINITY_DN6228_c0_g1_i2.p1 TRINITY_DN6228_c0_g1~~TRINITY_DN6228_c0_g1_i2.p1  ORF type:complete len:377 (-),score=41.96 TRINITY_DN6228_c0_g1_i2:404-1534(-)
MNFSFSKIFEVTFSGKGFRTKEKESVPPAYPREQRIVEEKMNNMASMHGGSSTGDTKRKQRIIKFAPSLHKRIISNLEPNTEGLLDNKMMSILARKNSEQVKRVDIEGLEDGFLCENSVIPSQPSTQNLISPKNFLIRKTLLLNLETSPSSGGRSTNEPSPVIEISRQMSNKSVYLPLQISGGSPRTLNAAPSTKAKVSKSFPIEFQDGSGSAKRKYFFGLSKETAQHENFSNMSAIVQHGQNSNSTKEMSSVVAASDMSVHHNNYMNISNKTDNESVQSLRKDQFKVTGILGKLLNPTSAGINRDQLADKSVNTKSFSVAHSRKHTQSRVPVPERSNIASGSLKRITIPRSLPPLEDFVLKRSPIQTTSNLTWTP